MEKQEGVCEYLNTNKCQATIPDGCKYCGDFKTSIYKTVKYIKRKQTKGQSLKYYDYEELEKIAFGMIKAKLTDPQIKAVKYLIVNNQLSMAGLSGHMRAVNSLEKMGIVENSGGYYRLDKGGE